MKSPLYAYIGGNLIYAHSHRQIRKTKPNDEYCTETDNRNQVTLCNAQQFDMIQLDSQVKTSSFSVKNYQTTFTTNRLTDIRSSNNTQLNLITKQIHPKQI